MKMASVILAAAAFAVLTAAGCEKRETAAPQAPSSAPTTTQAPAAPESGGK